MRFIRARADNRQTIINSFYICTVDRPDVFERTKKLINSFETKLIYSSSLIMYVSDFYSSRGHGSRVQLHSKREIKYFATCTDKTVQFL